MGNAKVKTDMIKKPSAQVSLELAVAFIGIFLLLLGALKIFVWVNQRLVLRQEAYDATRVTAAGMEKGLDGAEMEPGIRENWGNLVDDSKFPVLDIFGTKK